MDLELEIAKALSTFGVIGAGGSPLRAWPAGGSLEYEFEQALSGLLLPSGDSSATDLSSSDEPISYDRARRDNIEVAAQHALVRMSKSANPTHRQAAHDIITAVETGQLGGVWREDQRAPALRQKASDPNSNWTAILQGEDATMQQDPRGVGSPFLVYGRAAEESAPRLDAAFAKVAPRLRKPPKPKPCLPKGCSQFQCERSDYSKALGFVQAKHFTPSSGRKIQRIVIHITGASTLCSTVHHFRDPRLKNKAPDPKKPSAHYIVGRDGAIAQMVREAHVANHAGPANANSIGIEHAATPTLPPTDAQYLGSAELAHYLCKKYSIPKNRRFILGHIEADPNTTHKGCPNSVWDWNKYMGMIKFGF